jgi:hypothetical protein
MSTCRAPTRSCADEFVGRVADFGKNLKVGNGVDPYT